MYNEKQYIPQTLRDYQEKGLSKILESWQDPKTRRPILVFGTGGGKTSVIADLLRRKVDLTRERALVIAHSEELVGQLAERIVNQYGGALGATFGGKPGIGIVMAESDGSDARIVVGSRQSLHHKRLDRLLSHGIIDYFIIDECHHFSPGSTYDTIYKRLLAANPNLLVLGVTATPSRSDHKALGHVFTNIADEWTLEDGIKQGYLVPPYRMCVPTGVDVSGVNTQAGDYNNTKLMNVLDAANWLDLCIDAYMKYVVPLARPTLAFWPTVAMSQQFAVAMRAKGITIEHIDGETPKEDRRRILRAYKAGEISAITNVGVFTEGMDAPTTGCIFLARPTRSKILFTQILGRALRPSPGKHDAVLIDMTVNDTKALTIGSLLGKLVECRECGAEFYHGLSACPSCGWEIPKHKYTPREGRERDVNEKPVIYGTGLVAEHATLFEEAFAAWYSDGHDFMSCSVGDEGTLVIVPPEHDDYYRLIIVPKNEREPLAVIQRNEDLASIIEDGDREVKARASGLADKQAEWRGRAASEGQLRFLKTLGGTAPEGAMMGEVSMVISHLVAMKRVQLYRQRYVPPPPVPTPAPLPPPVAIVPDPVPQHADALVAFAQESLSAVVTPMKQLKLFED